MADIANIGFKVDTGQITRAKTALGKMGAAADKAVLAMDRMIIAMQRLNRAVILLEQVSTSTERAVVSINRMNIATRRLRTAVRELNTALSATGNAFTQGGGIASAKQAATSLGTHMSKLATTSGRVAQNAALIALPVRRAGLAMSIAAKQADVLNAALLRLHTNTAGVAAGARKVTPAVGRAGTNLEGGAAPRAVRNTGREFDRSARSADRFSKSVGKANGNLILLGRGMKLFSAIVAFNLFARVATGVIEMSDAFIGAERRLRQFEGTTKDTLERLSQLFQLAQSNRSGFDDTVSLFTRFKVATKEAGYSTTELMEAVSGLQKSVVLSGATAREASNAILQFSQAVQSNRLGGEEYRSVNEQLPQLLHAIAAEAGVSTEKLKKFAEAGGITAEIMIAATRTLHKSLDIDKEIKTVGEAWTQLSNAMRYNIGLTNQETQQTSRLVQAIDDLNEAVSDPSFQRGFEVLIGTVATLASWLLKVVTYMGQMVKYAEEGSIAKGYSSFADSAAGKKLAQEDPVMQVDVLGGTRGEPLLPIYIQQQKADIAKAAEARASADYKAGDVAERNAANLERNAGVYDIPIAKLMYEQPEIFEKYGTKLMTATEANELFLDSLKGIYQYDRKSVELSTADVVAGNDPGMGIPFTARGTPNGVPLGSPLRGSSPTVDDKAVKRIAKLREAEAVLMETYREQLGLRQNINAQYAQGLIGSMEQVELEKEGMEAATVYYDTKRRFAGLGAAESTRIAEAARTYEEQLKTQNRLLKDNEASIALKKDLDGRILDIQQATGDAARILEAQRAGASDAAIADLQARIILEQELKQLIKDGGTAEDVARLQQHLEAQDAVNKSAREFATLQEKNAALARDLGDSFATAFGDALEGSENLKRSLIELAAEIANVILSAQFDQEKSGTGLGGLFSLLTKIAVPVIGGLFGGGGAGYGASVAPSLIDSGFIPVGSAKGNIFQNGSITPFANGGVVNSPTLFPMANGTGLMGEAGPEAVMPLSRGADGKLGVRASGGGGGGGTTVNVNVVNQSKSEVEVNQNGDDIEVRILAIVAKDIGKGGSTYKAMNQRFTTAPRLNAR